MQPLALLHEVGQGGLLEQGLLGLDDPVPDRADVVDEGRRLERVLLAGRLLGRVDHFEDVEERNLLRRAGQRVPAGRRLSWLLLSGMAGGGAIWTTHFVAMLGFQMPLEHTFDPVLTVGSLLIAAGFTASGFYLTVAPTRYARAEIGGAVTGIGIIAMHFTGMAGLKYAGHTAWDPALVGASVLFALGFGSLTAHLLARYRARWSRPAFRRNNASSPTR